MIRMYRLVSGEVVIGKVEDAKWEDTIYIDRPHLIHVGPGPGGQPQVGFIPWSIIPGLIPGVSSVELKVIHVVDESDAPQQLEDGYLQATSGIVLGSHTKKPSPFNLVK